MADGFSACDRNRATKALRLFTQAGGELIDPGSFYRELILLDDGCPDGANVGVPTQDRDKVSLPVSASSTSAINRSSRTLICVVVSFIRFAYSKTPKRWWAFFMAEFLR